jgi:hypothetical protein
VTTALLVCAAFGGTILVLQAIMTLVGLGGDTLHTDVPSDVGHDFGGDFHADAASIHTDTGGDVHTDAAGGVQHHESQGHGSSRLFAVLSFRGVVAAMAFFGLGGLAAQSMDLPDQTVLLIGFACGGGALYGMYWIMQLLGSLHAEGNVHLERAVGLTATVYLRIPAARSGAGKVHVNLQNRTMEYLAITAGEPIATGARVVVAGVVNPETVEVRPLSHCEGDGNE